MTTTTPYIGMLVYTYKDPTKYHKGAVVVMVIRYLDLQLFVQSVPIVRIPHMARCTRYNITYLRLLTSEHC